MPQLDMFLTNEDDIEIVKLVFSMGGRFVPDILYDGSEYIEIVDLEKYLAYKKMMPHFFILADSFFRVPLETVVLKGGEAAGKFMIMPRKGGPSLDFMAPTEYVRDGVPHLGPAMLAHWPTYWCPKTKKNEKVPPELKRFYGTICRYVKKGALRTIPKGFWVGKHAIEAVRNGAKLVGPTGYEYKIPI